MEETPMNRARYTIYSSAILAAPLQKIWPEMRDFLNALRAAFADQITNIQWVEGGSAEKVPSLFEFRLRPSGALVREEIVARSEIDYTIKYRTIGVALSLVDYIGTFEFKPVTDEPNKTFMATTKEFSLVDGTDVEAFLAFYEPLVHQETRNMRDYFAPKSTPPDGEPLS